jgi:hypothetical protein
MHSEFSTLISIVGHQQDPHHQNLKVRFTDNMAGLQIQLQGGASPGGLQQADFFILVFFNKFLRNKLSQKFF